ncbi:MAG: STAS domain-containing protein [Cyanobacteria bacterium]|nr:STAS domain-containing protein [Cyanobacteriota bacterium]MEB3269546.1 STAS domain-containing protein [Leptolyngbya sp.]
MSSHFDALMVVQPSGVLNAANAKALQAQLTDSIAAEDVPGLMVDMSRVEVLDSAGLVALISVLRLARGLRKRFCLCAVPPSIRIVLELTQLDQVFEMVEAAPLSMAA